MSDFSVSYYLEINLGVSFVSVPGSIDLTFEPLPCLTLFGSTSEAQLWRLQGLQTGQVVLRAEMAFSSNHVLLMR